MVMIAVSRNHSGNNATISGPRFRTARPFSCRRILGLLLTVLVLQWTQPICLWSADPAEENPSSPPLHQQFDRPGEDWPWFLGLTHDGVSRETGLLEKWPENGPPLVWEKEVGTGYSAPSVLGQLLVLHHRIGNEDIVDAFNAVTGAGVWQYRYRSNFRDPYGYNNGPRCTPILTSQYCFTLGAEGKLLCLNIQDGSLVWERNLLAEYEIPDGFFGVGATPILDGDKLIVLVGGQPNSGVVAFRAATGEKLWEAVGKKTWDGTATGWPNDPVYRWEGDEMIVSYSSPIIATIHGQRHLLCLLRQGLVSLDPQTGRENFKFWFRSRTHESVNAARPVVVNDTIFITSSYRVGSALLRVNRDGKGYEVVWSDARNLDAHWSTPIAWEGHFFGFSGRHENEGELRCLDALTGKVKWATTGYGSLQNLARGPQGEIIERESGKVIPWPLYGRGAKIMVDGKFIVLAERGTLALVEVSTAGWREVSRCSGPNLQYPSWTAPVLSRGRLYLRDEDSLICLDLLREGTE